MFPPLLTPVEAQLQLASRFKALRLAAGYKRTTLAERAGVSEASLKRFESTGEISLKNLLRLPAGKDMADEGPLEYAYSLMAWAAGIAMPETRLFAVGEGGRFFGVKRFDRRPASRRLHVQRFSSLIHVSFSIPAGDYGDLLKATSLLTRNHPELERVFRLMVFNVLAHNRDDHAGNFAFLFNDRTGEWSFAPAYDLTFARGPGGEHTTTVLGEGARPSRQQCVHLGGQYGIAAARAESIFAEVAAAVSRWQEFAERAGVGEESRQRIGRYLAGGG